MMGERFQVFFAKNKTRCVQTLLHTPQRRLHQQTPVTESRMCVPTSPHPGVNGKLPLWHSFQTASCTFTNSCPAQHAESATHTYTPGRPVVYGGTELVVDIIFHNSPGLGKLLIIHVLRNSLWGGATRRAGRSCAFADPFE